MTTSRPQTKSTPQHTIRAKALPRKGTKELDIYAAEFAKLVDRTSPSRSDTPSEWLGRLPDEAYHYYREGISTFGSAAKTPIERRGRLYLLHTGLLFMWMKWGKSTAREYFRSHPDEGARRAASLITLEHYRRAGILARYETDDWFSQPVGEWSVTLISGAVALGQVRDADLRATLRKETTATCSVSTFSMLRTDGALPSRTELSLE